MSVNAVPIPIGERVTVQRDRRKYPDPKQSDPKEGTITRAWAEWLTNQSQIQASTARRLFDVELQDQTGNIPATDVSNGTLAAGLYRVSYYATIVRSATSSSSLTVTLDFTDRSVSKSISGAAITSNLTSAAQSGSFLIRIEKNSPVRYSTTYASVGATTMAFDLCVTLEFVR